MNTQTALSYQCPNCSAGLSFHPDKQKFCCEFCLSEFTEEELNGRAAEAEAEAKAEAATREAAEREVPDEDFCTQMDTYACPSCGAEIMTDHATAATLCPYCHNPVILSGRLAGQMRPHKVIPFQLDQEAATQRFLAFAGKKWFVPRDFIAKEHAEKITGIYYPFWVTDADTSAHLSARATTVRHWRQGNYRYTETRRFHVVRDGNIHFEDIVTPALREEDREMLDGILPYPSDSLQDFSMPYLSGFLAKKRDIEKESVREAVHTRMTNYAKTLLGNTINGYHSVTLNTPNMKTHSLHWDYTLMPIWLLTYQHNGKSYTYAMNGYTGKVYGQLPISGKRLALFAGIVGVLCGAAAALLRFLL